MSESDGSTNRQSRFAAELPAVLHADGREIDCTARNLSRSGVLLAGELTAPAGASVRVTLKSAAGDLEVTLGARVTRFGESPRAGDNRLALAFTGAGDAEREALEALVSRVMEGVSPAAIESLPATADQDTVRERLDRVPVAHRVALASRAMPKEREALIHDTNLHVLDALARNPGLRPSELRLLLRVRPLMPSTLETLAARWATGEEMRILIACHPNTPMSLAERLIGSLSVEGQKRAVRQPGLNPALRLKLGRRFSRGS